MYNNNNHFRTTKYGHCMSLYEIILDPRRDCRFVAYIGLDTVGIIGK